jgi:threonine/homoserine/homoserine lactone efflux protein
MPEQLLNILPVLLVFGLAIISPGPNFILVTKIALSHSRRSGLYSAFGVATGSGLFALAGMTGLLLLLTSVPHFPLFMRFLGGGYLAWLGIDMLRHCRQVSTPATSIQTLTLKELSATQAYRTGLLTNLTNPKAWAFYLSLFSMVMQPTTLWEAKALLNLAMFVISFGWYATAALLISSQRVQPRFLRAQPLIHTGLGILLLLLAGRVLSG